MKVKVEVSNRHIHLNKETYNMLFDEEMQNIKDISQKGEYASDKTVTIKNENYEIKNVRVMGPNRENNQVEISHNDALKFKINPPVKATGDLHDAEYITLQTQKSEVTLKCCIIAQRHVHINTEDAKKLGLENGQKVSIKVEGDKSGTMDAYVKVKENGTFAFHIDTDDANAFLLKTGDEVEILK